MRSENKQALLQVRNLSVKFWSQTSGHMPVEALEAGAGAYAVKNVSFEVAHGETLALVGESGSGKSVTAQSVLQLVPTPPAVVTPESEIIFDGHQMTGAAGSSLRTIRGNRAAMIFQEPMSSLNPLHTVERQITEGLKQHNRMLSKSAIRARVLELLELVGIRGGADRLQTYPHELSGGQRQRVMIAAALANSPDLLIADEPTTALDVTIQEQILDLLADLQKRFNMAMLLITHDLAIVRRMADRVCVMQHGEIVEAGSTGQIFSNPQHPCTQSLLAAEPSGSPAPVASNAKTVVKAESLRVHFPIKAGLIRRTVAVVKAVDSVSLEIKEGETLGVVGESGSGKSTLGLALLQLIRSEGRIACLGQEIQGMSAANLRPLRQKMQIVFQDPFSSLSPRMSVAEIIAEGLEIHSPELARNAALDDVICKVMDEVGLDIATRHRYPHEFSGGQRQRISIARALVLEPKVLILDEPTSALDRTIQMQIVSMLRAIQARRKLACMFISHDIAVVRAMSHRLLVMKDGKCVESGPCEEILASPKVGYTKSLLRAALHGEAAKNEAIKRITT